MATLNKGHVNTTFVSRRAFLALAAAGAGTALVPSNASASNSKPVLEITDSLQRSISINADKNKSIIPLGPNAQTFLEILCPSSLASLVMPIGEEVPMCKSIEDIELDSLPLTTYGRSETTSSATAQKAAKTSKIKPSLILDVGAPKSTTEKELDTLEKETGIPCAFIDISFGKLPDSFRKMSMLLNCSSRGETLANAVERALRLSAGALEASMPTTAFYAPRAKGVKVGSGISIQLEAIEHVGARPLTGAYDYDAKTINFDVLFQENPDIVIFDDTNIGSLLQNENDEVSKKWNMLSAIEWHRYVVSPSLMKSWFGSAILVQSIGVLWLARMLNPEISERSTLSEIQKLYRLFYDLDKTNDEISSLIG